MALDRGSRKDGYRECVENETLCIEHLGDSEEENEERRKVGRKKTEGRGRRRKDQRYAF